MKKIFIALAGLAFCFAISHNAQALDLVQTGGAGGAITFPNGTSTALDAFNPSTSVIMDGVSQTNQFALGAYHSQVFQKKSGKGFGMASDSSSMFFTDISAANATAPTVTTSNSTAFSSYTAM